MSYPRESSLLTFVTTAGILVSSTLFAGDPIDFNRDIRPILSDTCFKCHGPDEEDRQADLRLDQKENVYEESEVVIPFDLESELYQRLISDDEDLLMPPPDSGRHLTPEQIELFKKWIEQGAEWQEHWSFVAPTRPELPEVTNKSWPRNGIDYFVLAENEKRGLKQNDEADKVSWLRRVTLDLIGLPPTTEEVDAFVNDNTPEAYERVVDRLLESKSFGEHQARFWLDAARYGDTHGLHLDNYREMWLYRDWVINAMNDNKSYKDFVIEQLAGDLLESPTNEQLIATGFNRAHVTTNEGGSIKEEVFVRNVVDRVETTGVVFMGLTLGCATCHDHKYDPISQKEFYELFAYFNSLDANPMDGNAKVHAPTLRKPHPEQQKTLDELAAKIASIQSQIEEAYELVDYQEPEPTEELVSNEPTEFIWVDDSIPAGAKAEGNWQFVNKTNGEVQAGDKASTSTANGFIQHFFTAATVPLRVGEGDKLFGYVYLDPENPPQQIMFQWNDGTWEHRVYWGENIINFGADGTPARKRLGDLPEAGKWIRLEVDTAEVNLKPGAAINGWAFSQVGGRVFWDSAGIVSKIKQGGEYESLQAWTVDQTNTKGNGLPNPIKKIINIEPDKRNEKQLEQLKKHFIQKVHPTSRETFVPLQKQLDDLNKKRAEVDSKVPTTLVYRETKEPRDAFMLKRGEYDQRGEKVERSLPDVLPELPEGAPNDRLGLARWLVDPSHPLTARVHVNRLWQQFFGTGIVETAEDFGAQGTWPSHPRLLDWLAVDFVESDWDVKRLFKKIALSATYRQSAVASAEQLKIDPENRYLSRGPRFRLDAEILRDQALAVSGLLVDKIGGPSVKPPQPDGLWFVVGYSGSNTVRFKKDDGSEKVHRRSLYTFWKRTAPPPQMGIMDAPSRESCIVRRERTNTPLQALMLMNDPQYVEASRYFGQLIVDSHENDNDRIRFMFKRALGRKPTELEKQLLLINVESNRKEFSNNVEGAKKLLAIGEVPADLEKYDAVELATWTMAANLVMNMDEFVSKP